MASSSTIDLHSHTASERRRKARQDPSPDPIEELEEDVGSQEATDDNITDEDAHLLILDERVDEDRQASPIPGGSEDLSILVSFRTHLAMSRWRGEV